jgi:putative phosphoesterase
MLLGVVSDTHGHVEFARPAVRMLQAFAVERVLHCGDIGSPAIIELFAAWPTHFVFGNVDYNREALRAAIAAAHQSCHDNFAELDFAGRRIAMLHGDDMRLLEQTIAGGRFHLVCHGHTHVPRAERVEHPGKTDTLVVNPGALYRANRHTIAIVDLSKLEAEIIEVTQTGIPSA